MGNKKKASKAQKPKTPKIRKFEEAMLDVKHEFTTTERDDIARDMAARMTTRVQLEDTLKSISADYKAKMKLIDAEISDRHNKFTVGHEFRPTPVIVHFNKASDAKGKAIKKKGWKRIVRKDDGAFVRDEQMTPSDMHVELMDRRQIEEASKLAKEKKNKPAELTTAGSEALAKGDVSHSQTLNTPEMPLKAGEKTSTAAT